MPSSGRKKAGTSYASNRQTVAVLTAVITVFIVSLFTPSGRNLFTPSGRNMLIGVYEPNSPGSYGQVDSFAQQAGFTPRITSYYSTFTMPFPTAFAEQAASKGTMLLVQWQPRGTTNAAVASGTDDVYIEQFAQAVAALDQQVIISYGQEMNGNWYDWGAAPGGEATSDSADYIAAYQHVWEIFQQQHVRNVTWLWDPNISYTGNTPLKELYPGDQYVDWVGLDGYFAQPTDTFGSLFGPSITELRAFTSKPLLIAETGVSGAAGAGQLAGLFAGARIAGVIGVVYFDQAQEGDLEHQDWRLEDNPGSMAAFQAGVQENAERPLVLANYP
jgi:mannan endo-1,4-beta-mannosidase